jgi:ZIP family zinc transporter
MIPIIFVLAFATFLSTMIGGTVAIKSRKFLPFLFAFAAGCLIGVAFFDIFPEAITLAQTLQINVRYLSLVLVGSFLVYAFIERFSLTHHYHSENAGHPHITGPIGAGSLCIHSFLDGVAIGVAYLVNPAIGLIVAFAVIMHDFTDGINTVTLMFRNKHNVKMAAIFLIIDAVAPVLGVASTYFVNVGEVSLIFLLAAFSGEFLYIGAASLLPETNKHGPLRMLVLVVLGATLIFILTSFI